MSCDISHRHGSDLALRWLWCRSTAAAPIQPLAWELPHAASAALRSKKIKIKIRDKNKSFLATGVAIKRKKKTFQNQVEKSIITG